MTNVSRMSSTLGLLDIQFAYTVDRIGLKGVNVVNIKRYRFLLLLTGIPLLAASCASVFTSTASFLLCFVALLHANNEFEAGLMVIFMLVSAVCFIISCLVTMVIPRIGYKLYLNPNYYEKKTK